MTKRKQIITSFEINENYNLENEYIIFNEWYNSNVKGFHKRNVKTNNCIKEVELNTIPIAKNICSTMARITTDQELVVSSESENEEHINDINLILKNNNFGSEYIKFIERVFAFGLGAIITIPTNDKEFNINFISATNIIPIKVHNNNYTKVLFYTSNKIGKKYYTDVYIHEKGYDKQKINNYCFVSDKENDLGIMLNDKEMKEHNGLEREITINSKYSTFNVFTTLSNNSLLNNYLPTSIFKSSIEQMKSIDLINDSYVNEFIFGKKKILISNKLIKSDFDENGNQVQYFDTGEALYQLYDGEETEEIIKVIDLSIRNKEHQQGIDYMLSIIATNIGIDKDLLNFELASKNYAKNQLEITTMFQKTERTKESYLVDFNANINNIFNFIFDYLGYADLNVEFVDNVYENGNEISNRLMNEYINGIISKEEYLRSVKKWDVDKIKENEIELNKETSMLDSELM